MKSVSFAKTWIYGSWIYGLCALAFLSACSTQHDYLQSKSLPPLSESAADKQRFGQLYPVPETDRLAPTDFRIPFPPTVAIQDDANVASIQKMGDQFWVLNAKSPATTWTQLITFLQSRQIPILERDLRSATLTTAPFSTKAAEENASESLQVGSRLQYLLQLQKAFQANTTEIMFSNRIIYQDTLAPASEMVSGHLEDKLHAQTLARQLVDVLNSDEQQVAGDSFLATTIELEEKSQLKDFDGEPVLQVLASQARLLKALNESLNENGFIIYALDNEAQVVHFNRYRSTDKKPRWYNPFSWWSDKQAQQTSPYSLTFILSTLPDESQVNEVFDRPLLHLGSSSKTVGIPGYLLAYQQYGRKYTLYVRDGAGRKLEAGKARELLDTIRLGLI